MLQKEKIKILLNPLFHLVIFQSSSNLFRIEEKILIKKSPTKALSKYQSFRKEKKILVR